MRHPAEYLNLRDMVYSEKSITYLFKSVKKRPILKHEIQQETQEGSLQGVIRSCHVDEGESIQSESQEEIHTASSSTSKQGSRTPGVHGRKICGNTSIRKQTNLIGCSNSVDTFV